MFRQLHYMQDKEPGFSKEQILVISQAHLVGEKIPSFKQELEKIPGVVSVSASTSVPGRNNNNNGYRIKGRPENTFLLQTCWADYDFIETYGMKIISGRYFDKTMSTDTGACILNESAVKSYLLDDPFSTRFILSEDTESEEILMPVIGVVNDFHHESLRNPIAPYMFQFKNLNNNWGFISVRLTADFSSRLINDIEDVWRNFTAGSPMQSFFLSKDFERMYREEQQNARLSILFTILAIIIAVLGLYGLTSFTVVQRTKEIGVRKAFGATVGNIWYLIAREIVILVLIASVIAVPLIWQVAGDWLSNYHYRISLNAFDFLLGIVLAIFIALLTISYRAVRTARANPVHSLRYE
jgi:putative ABC transport system permease protein